MTPQTSDSPTAPGVLGDFVLARHPEAAAWLRGLAGFTLIDDGDGMAAALRGDARHGQAKDGARWMAVADLVAGRLDDGPRALRDGAAPQREWRGRFAQVAWHPGDRRAVAIGDHFSTLALYVLAGAGGALLVATDLRLIAASPWCDRRLDLASIYHYLNFSCVPGPRTVLRGVRRLLPGTSVTWADGETREARWFVPEYPEDLDGSDDTLARELRDRIVGAVEDYRPPGSDGWGCFMSGGTDSSSIVSILARRQRVRSFSIGFAEGEFDELGFAKIAAAAMDTEWFPERVSRAQTEALIPRIIDGFDQPFGNASAIPTLACADLARRNGVGMLVAGDGGDEIFGGNERYAKDKVMEAFFVLPGPIKALGRKVGEVVGRSDVHLLNRVENFFQRASLPNPERFYSDDAFASDFYDTLLAPELRAEVARDASLELMRELYALGHSGGPLHRIMRLDLFLAVAQNDLRKVDGAARAAGVSVRFPFLDPDLVAYAGRLPERHVVRGLAKRYLFKRAMKDILPEAILRKKKQGFGLPLTVWLREDGAFRDRVRDVLGDTRSRTRGWAQAACVDKLLADHERGVWDHSADIWRLFVLELWLRRHLDAR